MTSWRKDEIGSQRLALLAAPSVFTRYLAEKLAAELTLGGIVWEHTSVIRKFKIYYRRARKFGWLKLFDQAALKAYSSLFQHEAVKSAAQKLFGTPAEPKVPTINVKDINNERVLAFLAGRGITICVVSGTGIIKGSLLEAYSGRLINIHTGWTPYYRGAHGGFWALYNNDDDHCGVTIHVIDRGIDTGGILWQEHIALSPNDAVVVMAWKQQKAAADSIVGVIRRYIEGETQPRHCKQRGKLYYSPGLLDYLHMRKKVKAAKV